MYRLCLFTHTKRLNQTFISFLLQMQELETLLNSLIKRGWKPFGNDNVKSAMAVYTHNGIVFLDKDENVLNWDRYCSLRDLVSLESGLWQFCDKNWLLHEYCNWRSSMYPYICYWTTTYEYRLLESALIPEEELGKFLVDNIKLEWNSK